MTKEAGLVHPTLEKRALETRKRLIKSSHMI